MSDSVLKHIDPNTYWGVKYVPGKAEREWKLNRAHGKEFVEITHLPFFGDGTMMALNRWATGDTRLFLDVFRLEEEVGSVRVREGKPRSIPDGISVKDEVARILGKRAAYLATCLIGGK